MPFGYRKSKHNTAMEFSFDVNVLFRQKITRIVGGKLPRRQDEAEADIQHKFATVIDEMGIASAMAQGLRVPITTFQKLQSSNQVLYVLKDGSGKGAVVGILKVGHKKLFLADPSGVQHEVEPLCVLDFYVHESRQRGGCGNRLFEAMMQMENVKPSEMAIDRPSSKFLGFLKKHYNLHSFVKQANNFVVFDQFFLTCIDTGPGHRRLSLGQSPPDYGSPSHHNKLWKKYSAPFGEQEVVHSLGSPGTGRLTMPSIERPSPLSTVVTSLSPLLKQSHATAMTRGRKITEQNVSPMSLRTIPLQNPGHIEPKSSPQEVLRDRNRQSRSPPAADFNWSPDYALKRQKQGDSRAAPTRHNIITGIPIVTQQQGRRSDPPGSGSGSHHPCLPHPATNSKAPFLNMRQRHKRVATNSILAHGGRAYHTSSSAQPTGFYSASSCFESVQGGAGSAAVRYSKHRSVGTGPVAQAEEDFGSQRVPLMKAGKSVTFASGITGTSLSAHGSKHKK